ncbi:MAG: TonB-dependent receptor plug domain-containing protein [Steroidobacteraceae bacterium]
MGVVSAMPAQAQTASADDALQLEEIVVTAERRSEDLQKTAVSVTVRNGDDMLDQGRLSIGDYLADVAGVSGAPDMTSLSNPFANVTVRGVISNTPGDGTQVPTTAAYTDGVYEGLGSNYDVAGVQVLRGPQGTLYGRSATGGVIAIQTRNPELGKFTGNAAYTYGSDELRNAQAAINLPIGDVFALRVSGMSNEQDGYLSDLPSTQKAMRVKALIQPSDQLFDLAWRCHAEQSSSNGWRQLLHGDL